jgi:hypothetical protein
MDGSLPYLNREEPEKRFFKVPVRDVQRVTGATASMP